MALIAALSGAARWCIHVAHAFVPGIALLALGVTTLAIAPGHRIAEHPAPEAARVPQAVAAPEVGAASVAWTAPRPPLISQFESAHDLRAFVDAALRQPAVGGVFHALRALAECRRWREVAPEAEPEVVERRSHGELFRRRALADLANRRCAGFVDGDLADAEVERLFDQGLAQRDPLVAAYRGWLEAVAQGELDVVVAALAQVFAQADPALLDWVAQTGGDYFEIDPGPGGALEETARRRRRDAWALLPCALGADCTQPELGVASHCLGAGLCLHGRHDAIVLHGAWRSTQERAALASELAELKRAVRDHDARAALGLAPAGAAGGAERQGVVSGPWLAAAATQRG